MTDERTDHLLDGLGVGADAATGPLAAADPPGAVREPTVAGLPGGYVYGVTRYADILLEQAFPQQWADLCAVLDEYTIKLDELRQGGGGRAPSTARFDAGLEGRGWGKKNIQIEKLIDGRPISRVRGHEIDMFSDGPTDRGYPGIACEMEWNNKDPFYDRDLLNFQALHHEGALAVGIIVTRGPRLQALIERTILDDKRKSKYGKASTHWNKLTPRVNLGGGGECPLVLIGIEPERVEDTEVLYAALEKFREADQFKAGWRTSYRRWRDAEPEHKQLMERGYRLLGV